MREYKIDRYRADNGLDGLLIDIPNSSLVGLDISFGAGRYFCPPTKPELAHLLEHVVLMANEQYPSSAEFNRAIESDGADANASVWRFRLDYSLDIPDLGRSVVVDKLGIFTEALASPLFVESEIESEIEVVAEELTGYLNDPMLVLSFSSLKHIGFYPVDTKERLASLKNCRPQDLRDYYRRTHTTSNGKFVAYGNLGQYRSDLLRLLEAIDLPKGDGRLPIKADQTKATNDILRLQGSGPAVCLEISFVTPARPTIESAVAVVLFLNILLDGIDSRILGPGREQGLFYHISHSWADLARGDGQLWSICLQVSSDKLVAAVRFIVAELKSLISGQLTLQEVDAARRKAIGRLIAGCDDTYGIRGIVADDFFDRDWVIDPKESRDRIAATGRDSILLAGRQHIGEKPSWMIGLSGSVTPNQCQQLQAIVSDLWG